MPAYFAMFLPAEEGGYSIMFPDFDCIASEGDDLDDCLFMGADVLKMTIERMVLNREPLPVPSTYEEAQKAMKQAWEEGEFLDRTREPLLQLFPAPCTDDTPVKISISLPKSALVSIDRAARSRGLTRSGYLVRAAQAFA